MSDESVFRSIVIIHIALTLPIGLYHRIRSQTTGEALARREEGIFIMIGLAAMRVSGLDRLSRLFDQSGLDVLVFGRPAHWLRWIGAFLGLFAVPPLLFWTFRSLGKNLTDTVVTRREHTLVTHGPYRWVRHPFYDVVFLWRLP